MKTLFLLITLVGADVPVDFDTEVAPILSKTGCNAAACHGSAEGRGGFKLSLFGGDPALDYESIVRDREGRRVRFAAPEDSLLLAKPTGMMDHGGGLRMAADGAYADVVSRWIAQGAQRRSRMRLEGVTVEPQHFVASSTPTTSLLQVTARFRTDQGETLTRDVTSLAVYEASDASALSVTDDGKLTVKRRGRSVLVVRFMSQVLTVQVTAPVSDDPLDLGKLPRRNWIDDQVFDTLQQLGIPPSAPATDVELVRRVTLDLTGRLPTVAQAQSYVRDRSATKYEQLVETLLQSEAFNDYWCFRLMTLLRVGGSVRDNEANRVYAEWIRTQVVQRRSLAETASKLLTAVGDSHEHGPANFYRTAPGPREQAEFISEALLGVRLRCANCHNHPLDRWTQDDYHGLAALLANVEAGRVVKLRQGRSVNHPRTGTKARPRIPGERFIEPRGDARVDLAAWLTDDGNPYFAKAMANRLWKALMGRGLVEPVDDIRDTNPPTHPELLRRLQEEFVRRGYRIRPLLRTIVMSSAYQRSTRPTDANRSDDHFYSRALVKPLEAEVLVDAIGDVTGVAENFGGPLNEMRAIELFDAKVDSQALDVLGRCSRSESCETAPGFSGSGGLSARLHLLNGKLLNDKIVSRDGVLRKLLDENGSTESIVASFYCFIRALSRPPGEAETKYWRDEIGDNAEKRQAALEDFVWSLLGSSAFSQNH